MGPSGYSPPRHLFVGLLFASLACGSDRGPDLEDQVADPRQRAKRPCPALPAPAYRLAADLEGLSLDTVDCGLALPTRLRFDPSGELLLVAELKGVLEAYVRGPGEELGFLGPIQDLGDLRVHDEAGLTSVFFGVGFDLSAPDPTRRDVFLSYQRAGRNVVRRLTLSREAGSIVASDGVDIWVASDRTGQAHQIQDGFGLLHEGEPHVLFAVGDGNRAENARNPLTPNGTLQLVRRDGALPAGVRPWPAAPTTVAVGIRNVYSLLHLPPSIDPREGVIGLENGNGDADRAWLVRLGPPGGGAPAPMDLGYVGDDGAPSWTSAGDPHTPSALGGARTAVFRLFSPPLSPTGAALHPGGGPFPASGRGTANVVVAFFGKSGDPAVGPGRTLELLTVTNVEGAALQSSLRRLVERRPETQGLYRHPVAVDVDPRSGDIWFADIISGDLMRIRVPPRDR